MGSWPLLNADSYRLQIITKKRNTFADEMFRFEDMCRMGR